MGLNKTGFDPANDAVTDSVSLLQFHGTCTVYIQLVENSANPNPKFFGGTLSDVRQADVALGEATTLDATESDFDVAWDGPPGSHVVVKYVGSYDNATVADVTQNWRETILAPDGTSCGSDDRQPTRGGITFDPDSSCVNSQPGGGWQVRISYDDAGTSDTHSLTKNLSGPPPGYVPCTVDQSKFAGTWAGTHNKPAAELTFSGNDADLSGCNAWSYTLIAPGDVECGDGPRATDPSTADPVTINVGCDSVPADTGWSIKVTYRNPNNSSATFNVTVSGTPP
jgi:hypothetical protein